MDESREFAVLESKCASMIERKGWADEHTPKNVSMSIAVEAAELMELFQWDDPGRAAVIEDDDRFPDA